MSTVVSAAADINSLSTDLIHHILSLLPLPSLLRSSSVCKLWRSLILSSGAAAKSSAWFFLLGIHNTSSRNHQSFAFDPLSSAWHLLPSPLSSPSPVSADSLSSPLLFSITTALFSFSTPFHPLNPSFLPPLHFPRINPLVATVGPGQSFVIVGGVKFIGNLVDIEDDRLPVEIFDPDSNSWRLHDPLPPEFHPANSFSLSSALFCRRLHVFGISNHLLSSFNLDTLSWSPAVPLRPPGLQSGFLVSCREKLLLVGISNGGATVASFNLWEICDVDGSAGFVRIAVMPVELLEWLVEGSGEDENKYASIKCVGAGNLVYVFNEEYYRKYPACVCDVGKGEWRRLPELPSPFNKFHKPERRRRRRMDRYQRVEKAKVDVPISENEIRITSQGLVRNYISYASSLLQERQVREIVLKAMGQAISKTVAIAEMIKKRMPRLHQDTAISSVSITDVWEPIEEGLVPVEMTRHVSMISITLSFRELNESSPGYQAPLHSDEPKPQYRYQQQQQPRQARPQYNSANEDSYARARGRGRGRSWSRGGYGNYQGGNYQGESYRGGSYHGGNYQGEGNYQGRGNYQGEGNYQGRGNYRGEGNYQGRGNYRGEGNYQGRGNYRGEGNYQGRGNYRGEGNYQGRGNYRGEGDYQGRGNYRGRGNYQGEGNYQGGGYHEGGGNYQSGYYQDNGGYSNYGRGGGRSRGWNYRGMGYERGRGGGGRGYGQGRGRMGGRSWGGGGGGGSSSNQA